MVPVAAACRKLPFETIASASLRFAERAGDILTPFQSFLDGRDELSAGMGLEDVTKCARSEGRVDDLGVRVNRQKNDCGFALVLLQLAGDLDAAEFRHGDIEDNDVRVKRTGCLERGRSVLHDANDLEVRFEKRSYRPEQRDTIISPKNSSHKFFL